MSKVDSIGTSSSIYSVEMLQDIANISKSFSKNDSKRYLKLEIIIDRYFGSSDFYIALYNKEKDEVTFPYFRIKKKERHTSIKNISNQELLLYDIIDQKKSILKNKKDNKKRYLVPSPFSWIGVPMEIGEGVFGAIVVLGYHQNIQFNEEKNQLLSIIGISIGTSLELRNSREDLKEKDKANKALFKI